jgi:hypothetical protein
MWNWMHKNIQRIHTPYISEEYNRDFSQVTDGITQIVIDAVKQHNEMLPWIGYFEHKKGNESLIKEAEEKADKEFLDEVFDNVIRLRSYQ